MNERTYIGECILAWAIAKEAAKDNPDLLLAGGDANYQKCVRRMKEIDRCESEMLSLADRPNLPAPLQRYIRAVDDRGCGQCWSSSSAHGWKHGDCESKIDEYFMSQFRLVEYGLNLAKSA